MSELFHHLVFNTACRHPGKEALVYKGERLDYGQLFSRIQSTANTLLGHGLQKSERVGVYLEKRPETVGAIFGASAAGGVFVPINPVLKPEQVAYILQDCNVRILVTSAERLKSLAPALTHCQDLRTILVIDGESRLDTLPRPHGKTLAYLNQNANPAPVKPHRAINTDMAAILYTSGSTGRPKGVVLSHLNMVTGAKSVAQYLELKETDRILAVLPLSFDYGLNQVSTAFLVGGCAVLMNHLLPIDVIKEVQRENITGLAAVPPLWIQLAQLTWPQNDQIKLRYFTNSGGAMPLATLEALRTKLPGAKPYLMYGLTEAFRSTYLPPEEVDRRPDSMGRAIPNAEILVVREDGTPCAPNEPGELVHRGALVSMGYWNDAEKTAERFRPTPGRDPGLVLQELAVWSGDTVRMDEEGFLYFIGRRDEMIKTSGYRVSPGEVEEVLYATKMVGEAAAFGVPHEQLGQAIVVVTTPNAGSCIDIPALINECRKRLPTYMVPSAIKIYPEDRLPRNPNGKIDRKLIAANFQ
jgi:acyl-CoA ligase (AMP-forming) (exosortase A-associated)